MEKLFDTFIQWSHRKESPNSSWNCAGVSDRKRLWISNLPEPTYHYVAGLWLLLLFLYSFAHWKPACSSSPGLPSTPMELLQSNTLTAEIFWLSAQMELLNPGFLFPSWIIGITPAFYLGFWPYSNFSESACLVTFPDNSNIRHSLFWTNSH